MYNEQLEQLIDAALTDGTLTEKEKQILYKKAMVMGVDLDEFEMVLEARLIKLKKEVENLRHKKNELKRLLYNFPPHPTKTTSLTLCFI